VRRKDILVEMGVNGRICEYVKWIIRLRIWLVTGLCELYKAHRCSVE
jgi:hypothetical protein